MKTKTTTLSTYLLTLLVAELVSLLPASAQPKQTLQEFINSLSTETRAGSSDVIDVDLSTFSDTELSETWTIDDGKTYRIHNGTIVRKLLFLKPLIVIDNKSYVEIGENAVIKGETRNTTPLIQLNEGHLYVTAGTIANDPKASFSRTASDGEDNLGAGREKALPPTYELWYICPAVTLTHAKSWFDTTGGYTDVVCQDDGHVNIWGGSVNELYTFSTYVDDPDNIYRGRIDYGRGTLKKVYFRNVNAYLYLLLSAPLDTDITLENYKLNQRVAQVASKREEYEHQALERLKLKNGDGYKLVCEQNNIYVRTEAPSTSRTVDVPSPGGTLPDLLSEWERDNLEELYITGYLNGTDIKLIREMGNKSLKTLGISGASIVRGGEQYLVDYTPSAHPMSADKEAMTTLQIAFYVTENDTISTYMFAGLSALEKLVLPHSVTTICEGAFMDCPRLQTIVFGSNLHRFASSFIFYGSNNISDLAINNWSIIHLENGVIYDPDYSEIIAVTPKAAQGEYHIRSTVFRISPYAFAGCMEMTGVVLPPILTHIPEYAFCQSGLQSVALPNTVKEIWKGAFLGCSQLREVSFSESVDSIAVGAFARCDLEEADLSQTKITSLKGDEHSEAVAVAKPTWTSHLGVFEDNNNLKKVILPETLRSMGGKVFTSAQLSDIYSPSGVPPAIYYQYYYNPGWQLGGNRFVTSDTFVGVNYQECRLHIPQGSLTAYQAATGWKEFLNSVEDLPGTVDPNVITDEDWLQRRLDEIAKEKPWSPVELQIAEGGIVLTKTITVQKDCKAVISGGPITLSPNAYGHTVFSISGWLEFQDITIDLANHVLDENYTDYFSVYGGYLKMGQNVVFNNVYQGEHNYSFFRSENGKISLFSGDITMNGNIVTSSGGEVEVYGGELRNVSRWPTIISTSWVLIGGGTVSGEGDEVFKCKQLQVRGGLIESVGSGALVSEDTEVIYEGGTLRGDHTYCNGRIISYDSSYPTFRVMRICVTTEAQTVGDLPLPELYIGKDAIVHLTSDILELWRVTGDWENMQEGHVIMDNISTADFSRLKPAGLPEKRNIKYDNAKRHAYFHRMSLAEWIEELDNEDEDQGTEDAPIAMDFPDDDENGDDIGTDDNGEDDDIELGKEDDDGNPLRRIHLWWRDRKWKDWLMTDGWPHRATLNMKSNVSIRRGSSLRWSRLNVSARYYKNFIHVWGIFILDGESYVRRAHHRFVRIRTGGRVIVRGVRYSSAGNFFYNEGGTLVFEKGEVEYDNTYDSEITTEADRGSIYNDGGTAIISGGTLAGMLSNVNGGEMLLTGDAKVEAVRNEASLSLGTTMFVPTLYMKPGANLRLLCSLPEKLQIRYYSDDGSQYNREEDMPQTGETIIEADENYKLTQMDVDMIDCSDWPAGYRPVLSYDRPDGQATIVMYNESAGIYDLTLDAGHRIQPVYDLMGRRVTRMVSGQVYLKGGKKFVAK